MYHEKSIELTSLLNTFSDAVILLDTTATILATNERAAMIIGVGKHKLFGSILWQVAPQIVTATFYRAVVTATRTRIPFQMTYYSPVIQIWLRVYLSPTDEGIALFFHEEVEPIPLQDSIRQRAEGHLDLLETISERAALLTPEGLLLEITQRPLIDVQVQREEVVGKPFSQFPLWSSASVIQEQLRAAIAQAARGDIGRFEARVQLPTGQYLDLALTLSPHWDENQQVEYLTCVGHDITERKRTEEELHSMIEAIPHFVCIGRPDGTVISSNQRWLDYLDMTIEQAYGFKWRARIHPDDQERILKSRKVAINANMLYEVEYRLQDGVNGDYRWFLMRTMPQQDAEGIVVSRIVTITDIDEQKRMEIALRQSQERERALMESNIIGTFLCDGEIVIESNDAFLRMTGYNREDLAQGKINWIKMTAPEYLAVTEYSHRQLEFHRDLIPYEKEYICKDGTRLPVVIGGVVTQPNASRKIGFVLDNSARKELEQRKDDFLSMASHELRTPLTALRLQTQMLRRQLAKQNIHTVDAAFSRMEGQFNTITRLVEELFDISKIQAGKLEYAQETVNLSKLLQELVEVVQQTQMTHNIIMSSPINPVLLVGDRDRLGQVFLNLVSNAIKYSPDADQITIDMTTSADAVKISVRDQGIGIPQEQHEKIFERFYRAAPQHQRTFPGLGMGLSIGLEIVKHYRGTITVESEVGMGSTFHVTLPCIGFDENI